MRCKRSWRTVRACPVPVLAALCRRPQWGVARHDGAGRNGRHRQDFPRRPRAEGRALRSGRRRSARADGRERRRQVDADEDPRRHLQPRWRRGPARRPAGGTREPAPGAGTRHRHHPPGTEPDARPHRRAEHLHRPRAAPARAAAARRTEAQRRCGSDLSLDEPCARSARLGRDADHCQAADGRDRQGAELSLARADHGRADGGAQRRRDQRTVRDHRAAEGRGRRHRLHLAQDGRDQAHLGPRDGDARRRICRHRAGGGHADRDHHLDDGGPGTGQRDGGRADSRRRAGGARGQGSQPRQGNPRRQLFRAQGAKSSASPG